MPYIKRDARKKWSIDVDDIETPGELNYYITRICIEYTDKHGKSYGTFNDIVGALECCKLELYRRAIAPYEDLKIGENGDVY